MSRKINVGVVGATGMVGEVFLELLAERQTPVKELRLFASDRSAGQKIEVLGRTCTIETLSPSAFEGLDVVFFSSGDDISREWAPRAAQSRAVAIDNSAAFRMHADTPLVVPEVNGHLVSRETRLIANPNCSTIQLVLALKPLSDTFGLEQVHVATYQSVSGAGRPGQTELRDQISAWSTGRQCPEPQTFPQTIAMNCVPQIGSFSEDGFCSEESKIRRETKKILGLPELRVSAFTVRIPAWNSHSEAVWVRLKKQVSRQDVLRCLAQQPGVHVDEKGFVTAQQADRTNPVYVSRVHQDPDDPNTWLMWVVADNLRKGAALNGLQIAERIFDITPST